MKGELKFNLKIRWKVIERILAVFVIFVAFLGLWWVL